MGRTIWKRWGAALLACLAALLLTAAGQGEDVLVKAECTAFKESAKELKNPNRGFFHMHGFIISDEDVDYGEEVTKRFSSETDAALVLVEINLKEYRDRPISSKGLANLEKLFQALAKTEKQLILRFLYDWEGRAKETEPETIGQILSHMRQLETLLRRYSRRIFTLQGVFVGDCGEMHGSEFFSAENLLTLARQLADVTDESTYLAVRTPAQWRRVARVTNPAKISRKDKILALRLGLFNDGMLGSSSDLGTYGNGTLEADGPNANWTREDELAFQNILCRLVPNGGETTVDNPHNDLKNAVKDLAAMHVTYLNRDHDGAVLQKWAGEKISEEGCFNGVDGLTYVERHLGYRLVIREARMQYNKALKALSVAVDIQNVGFAPLYKEAIASVVLWNRQSGEKRTYFFYQDVRRLAGGADSGETMTLLCNVPLVELEEGEWEAFLELKDKATSARILFGNEQGPGQYGYSLGQMRYSRG